MAPNKSFQSEINRQAAELLRQPATEETVRGLEKLAAQQKAHQENRAVRVLTKFSTATPATSPGQALAEALVASPAPTAPGRVTLLSQKAIFPEGRRLDGSLGDLAKIAAVKAPEALTAAGLCAPLEALYDVNVVGVADRPIRDTLAQFQAERGGIQYRQAIDASQITAGIWTVADDEAVTDPPGASPVKAVQVFDCPDVETANVRGIYSLLQFSNMSARYDREYADAVVEAAGIAFAKLAENTLLSDILAGSTLVTAGPTLGAARDVLAYLDQSVAYYRNRRRLSNRIALTMIMPLWIKDMLRADIVRAQQSADVDASLRMADDLIGRWFTARGVRAVWHLDGRPAETVNGVTVPAQTFPAAVAGQALPAWPGKADIALFASGDWLFLDGGRLDLGLVRDSVLNRTNRYQVFVEAFEGVAFTGVESLRLVLTLEPTGEATAPKAWAA